MATPSYTRYLDTLATSALDYYSGRPHECIHDGGEKFLRTLLERGRVMAIPHTEHVFHDVVFDHGQNTNYYGLDDTGDPTTALKGGKTGGATVAQATLATTPTEVLTSARFQVAAGTRNIVLEQSMPAGNRIDQINTRIKANLSKIFNEEEQLLLLGQPAVIQASSSPATYAARGAVSGDTARIMGESSTDLEATYTAGLPMSLMQFFASQGASVTAGLKNDDINNWAPDTTYLADESAVTSTINDGATALVVLAKIQEKINGCGYSEEEHTTHVWVSKVVFQHMVSGLITKGALPDPVRADIGNPWNYKIPFGGVEICWSRYLTASSDLHIRDIASSSTGEATITPIFGLNMDTFRYNIATDSADMTAEGLPGFVKQVGPIIPMVDKTNVFKRIAFSRCLSVENGRRSSFALLDRAEG